MNYLVLAMKRSGHHVIMNWIKAHTGDEIYNNVCFGWNRYKFLTMVNKVEAVDGIANIEDFDLDMWRHWKFDEFPFVKNAKVVLVWRSPLNWLASCYARKDAIIKDRRDVYKYLDHEYINDSKHNSRSRIDLYKRYVSHDIPDYINVSINFDNFVTNKKYRKMKANELGFKLDEERDEYSLKTLSRHGGGSSFKNKADGRDMEVTKRYLKFRDDPEFKLLSEKLLGG